MPRLLVGNKGGQLEPILLPPEFGGTGQVTAEESRIALGLVPRSLVGVALGLIPINALGLIDEIYIPSGIELEPTISGALSVNAYKSIDFYITNFDIGQTYEISATLGTVTRANDKVTYKSNGTIGLGQIVVNDKIVPITVKPNVAPVLAGNLSLFVNQFISLTITNYDSDIEYTLSVTAGNVHRVGNTISYLADSAAATVTLDVNGTLFTIEVVGIANIIGPSNVFEGTTSIFIIDNYSAGVTYTVEAIGGSVAISDNIITYVAPSNSGNYGFTLNGVSHAVTVVSAPNITGPESIYNTGTGSYIITNYNAGVTYTLAAITGSVSRIGNTITYSSPVSGDGGFIINGKTVSVSVIEDPIVSGVETTYVGRTQTFTITNYTVAAAYTLTAITGTVSRSGNVITYIAPLTAGNGGFTLNGRTTSVIVTAYAAPTISGPSSVGVGTNNTFLITNYDANNFYTISASIGSVYRSGATLTYVAPTYATNAGFVVTSLGGNSTTTSVVVVIPTPTISSGLINTELLPDGVTAVTYINALASAYTGVNYIQTEWELIVNCFEMVDGVKSTWTTNAASTTSSNELVDYDLTAIASGIDGVSMRVRHYSSTEGYTAWSGYVTVDNPDV